MTRADRRRQAPSWIGTLVVVIAVLVILLRAAAELRRSVEPRGPAPVTTPSTSPRPP